jgi:hypothetical protein
MFIVDKLKERSKAKDDGVAKPSPQKGIPISGGESVAESPAIPAFAGFRPT